MANTLQILHASDLEGGVDAIDNAPNFAAIIDRLEDLPVPGPDGGTLVPDTVILSAGDNYIPGPFFNAAADRSLREPLQAVYEGLFGLEPGALSNLREGAGRVDISIMNAIGFDASALGNHEFDLGPDTLADIIGTDIRGTTLADVRWLGAQFPYLSANLDVSGNPDLSALFTDEVLPADAFRSTPADLEAAAAAPKLAPSAVIELGEERIGVVAATTPLLERLSSPGDVTLREPGAGTEDMALLARILQPEIDALTAQGIDKVVLVTHLQQLALEQELVPLLEGVDVAIAGGSDTLLADDTDVLRPGDEAAGPYPIVTTNASDDDNDGNPDPALIVSTAGEYSHVGRLVVTFDDHGVVLPDSVDPTVSGAFATTDATVAALHDGLDPFAEGSTGAAVRALTTAVEGVVIAKDGEIFGRTAVYLDGTREEVRTQETNLGNLTADANLAATRTLDPEVMVSIKNGGGIRAPIGEVVDTGEGTSVELPPQPNPLSGKEEGEISRLDIENALRFDNELTLLTLSAEDLLAVIEHGVSATAPGATPGQFPQVGGLSFSFDPALPPGARVQSLAILGDDGAVMDVIARDGAVVGDPDRPVRVVTLNFLADGGDGYPFPDLGEDRVDTGIGEQQALADYLQANFAATPFMQADLPPADDTRIQNLNARDDTVLDDQAAGSITLTPVGQFVSPDGTAEIVAHDPATQRLFVTDSDNNRVDVLDVSDPAAPERLFSLDIAALGDEAGGVNSVAVSRGLIAVAVENSDADADGLVAFFTNDGLRLGTVSVGNLPDMLTFTPDGTRLLVANEGEPTDAGDPLGSVSIIDLTNGLIGATVQTLTFESFNGQEDALRSQGVRIFPDTSVAADLEPEYIAVSPDGTTAFVTLQENNAVAVVDIENGAITGIVPLGSRDHNVAGDGLDASDRDGGINIQPWPVQGLFMPDAIASYTAADGQTYYVTGNEGDARDEDTRVADLDLDPAAFPDAAGLQQDPALGRLEVSTIDGDSDGDGDFDALFSLGTRSFSIWDSAGTLVFDSGDAFERITADQVPALFNSNGTPDSFDGRSDNKGPEPEGVAVGTIDGQTYAFIGLERVGGIMVYNVTEPGAARFVQYVNTLDTFETADISPEGLAFIAAADSPTGAPLLAVAHEESGTTTLFEIMAGPDLPPGSGVTEAAIHEIQGAGHVSPLAGQTVRTTGIVTAVDSNGFHLQDPAGDGNDATADGIFVFTGDEPAVTAGDAVEVTGEVTEFFPGGRDTGNLSVTQIVSPEIAVLSSGNPLPAPTVIGQGGRVPPNEVVIGSRELPVDLGDPAEAAANPFNPDRDGIDFYESLEGMRVTVEAPAAVSPTNRFGETWVLANGGADAAPDGILNARGGIDIAAEAGGYGDLNPERIQIQYDGDLLPAGFEAPTLTTGDGLSDVTGVVGYAFGNFEVAVTEPFTVDDPSTNQAEVTGLVGAADRLTVATYNVLNLAPQDTAQIADLAGQIVTNLQAPDILALQEIQDDSGEVDDGTLTADQTLQALVDAVTAAGGPAYAFASAVVDEDGETGGAPGGNIRNAFLYNPDRVDAVEISTLEVPALTALGVSHPDAFDGTRDPLLGTFTFNGEDVTLINNHLTSRFGSTPIFGAEQPFVQAGEAERARETATLNEVVDALLANDPEARVVVLGDLNTFEFTDELAQNLRGFGGARVLTNLIDAALPGDEAYTFNFQGNSQVLDHIFVTETLLDTAQADVVHINTDFSDQTSDHDPVVAAFTIPAAGPTLADFDLPPAAAASLAGLDLPPAAGPTLADFDLPPAAAASLADFELPPADGPTLADFGPAVPLPDLPLLSADNDLLLG